jgi:hypothetical protein
MGFLEFANKRYSVRAYKPVPVEDEKLAEILKRRGWLPQPATCNRSGLSLSIREEGKRN